MMPESAIALLASKTIRLSVAISEKLRSSITRSAMVNGLTTAVHAAKALATPTITMVPNVAFDPNIAYLPCPSTIEHSVGVRKTEPRRPIALC